MQRYFQSFIVERFYANVIHCSFAFVEGFTVFNVIELVSIVGSCFWIQSAFPSEFEVACCYWITVAPFCITQFECIFCSVFGNFIAFRSSFMHFTVFTSTGQTFKGCTDNSTGSRVFRDSWVSCRWFGVQVQFQNFRTSCWRLSVAT
ncbi:Uncharacterised protein [Mycobacterium tuberculosis]|nr:Uncharacterised protein [Mycobacterium tuberculosis]